MRVENMQRSELRANRLKKGRFSISILSELYLYILFYGMLFQIPLGLNHFDEIIILCNILIILYYAIKGVEKKYYVIWCTLIAFAGVGLVGNFLWNYQSAKLVLIDFVDNIKFFVNMFAVFFLCRNIRVSEYKNKIVKHCYFAVFILIVQFVICAVGQFIFQLDGYKIRTLFYTETVLTAIICVLMALMLTLKPQKNILYFMILSVQLLIIAKVKSMILLLIFWFIYFRVVKKSRKISIKDCLLLAPGIVYVAWDRILVYYSNIHSERERTTLTKYGFILLKDYFPFGTGFATFCSYMSTKKYSPVYYLYGMNYMWNLGPESIVSVMTDVFWPMIMGQTGIFGLIFFITAIILIYKKMIADIRYISILSYASGIMILLYLLFNSFAEGSFSNWNGWLLGMALGFCLAYSYKKSQNTDI